MKKLYKNQKYSLYEIQIRLNLSAITLYNYARGKRDIDTMQIGTLLGIAHIENIEPMELYKQIKKYQKEGRK